jgi:hypothetical protein
MPRTNPPQTIRSAAIAILFIIAVTIFLTMRTWKTGNAIMPIAIGLICTAYFAYEICRIHSQRNSEDKHVR